jgi:hypothetical protein
MHILDKHIIYHLLTMLESRSFTRFVQCCGKVYKLGKDLIPVKRLQPLVRTKRKIDDTDKMQVAQW